MHTRIYNIHVHVCVSPTQQGGNVEKGSSPGSDAGDSAGGVPASALAQSHSPELFYLRDA